jgi:hypothetical protein
VSLHPEIPVSIGLSTKVEWRPLPWTYSTVVFHAKSRTDRMAYDGAVLRLLCWSMAFNDGEYERPRWWQWWRWREQRCPFENLLDVGMAIPSERIVLTKCQFSIKTNTRQYEHAKELS